MSDRAAQSESSVTIDFSRQSRLIPAEPLCTVMAVVVGLGAVGRQVACLLSSAGVPCLRLIDFDTVGAENVPTQLFRLEEVGVPKTEAVQRDCGAI